MLQNHFAFGIEDESDIEEAILPIRMPRFRLGHDEAIPFAGELAELFGFFAGNIDGTFAREFRVIEIENLVIETPAERLREWRSGARECSGRKASWRL